MKNVFRNRRCRPWAALRWVVVAAALPLVWACTARTLEPPVTDPTVAIVSHFKASINNKLDILFMIDNSQSMSPLQTKLLSNFPVFMNVLKALPNGLPDVHVAVVSSDAGPGKFDLGPGSGNDIHCAFQGDKGLFQTAPRGGCAASPLPAGQTFLAASNNAAITNYTGDITDAFTCIAALGEGGCGFESQLKSVRWALDANPDDDDPAPDGTAANNNGFLRPEAYLGIILVTNEDDCSVPTYSDLIDPNSTHNADRYGPLSSFRCNEYGHLCTNVAGAPPGTLAPPVRGANSLLTGCVSNDVPTADTAHPPGLETKVSDEVAFLQGLKTDPTQILVAAITGPVTPYSVDLASLMLSDGSVELQPVTDHSCLENSGEYADPAIRIQQWVNGVNGFGGNGLPPLEICADTFASSLTQIAKVLSQKIGPQCVTGTVRNTAAGNPDCTVEDDDVDAKTNTSIPACATNNNTPPCWSLDDDATNCSGAKVMNINRGTVASTDDVNTQLSCALCPDGLAEIGCP